MRAFQVGAGHLSSIIAIAAPSEQSQACSGEGFCAGARICVPVVPSDVTPFAKWRSLQLGQNDQDSRTIPPTFGPFGSPVPEAV